MRIVPSLILVAVCSSMGAQSQGLLVRFAGPARAFEEAAPTGNGRLGATVYGGTGDERIDLNESSMWSGSVHDSDRPHASDQLPEIRRLLLAGDNVGAEALVNKSLTSADRGGERSTVWVLPGAWAVAASSGWIAGGDGL